MAADYRQDPGYQETRGRMFGSHLKGAVWGIVATVALAGAVAAFVAGGGWIAAGIASALVGLFSAKKAYDAQVDERAGLEEISARRTAEYVQQRGPAQDLGMSSDLPSKNWQQDVAARREVAAMAAQQSEGAVR